MRLALVVTLVGACSSPYSTGDDVGTYDPGSVLPPTSSGNCEQDTDCGVNAGLVCARDYSCDTPDQVVTAHITWTISGQPANATTCANISDLDIQFTDDSDEWWFGFSPVPCVEGKFTIDKLPRWYTRVGLGPVGPRTGNATAIDPTTGTATIDLPY
jgi:hypothetical protein